MNAVVNVLLDRTCVQNYPVQSLSLSDLCTFVSDLSLIDIYRILYPTRRQYTFYSARHKSYSRLFYILTSNAAYSKIHSVNIVACPLSHHSMILANLSLMSTPNRAPRWHFNTTLLRNKDFCVALGEALSWFIGINAGTVDDPRFLWDAIKNCIRSFSISFASQLNKFRLKEIAGLEAKLNRLENQQKTSLSESAQIYKCDLYRIKITATSSHCYPNLTKI